MPASPPSQPAYGGRVSSNPLWTKVSRVRPAESASSQDSTMSPQSTDSERPGWMSTMCAGSGFASNPPIAQRPPGCSSASNFTPNHREICSGSVSDA